VKVLLMLSDSVPPPKGPTVRLPMLAPTVAFNDTLLLSWTGLLLVTPMVTAEVVAGRAPVWTCPGFVES